MLSNEDMVECEAQGGDIKDISSKPSSNEACFHNLEVRTWQWTLLT